MVNIVLNFFDAKYGVENFLLKCTSVNGLQLHNVFSTFFSVCIDAWCKLKAKNVIKTREDILCQNIFGNVNIVTNQNQSIFFSNWTKSGFVTLRDMWDEERKKWVQGNKIYNQLDMKRNWIAEYTKIKLCIPEKWKNVLKANSDMQNDADLIQNTDFYLAHDEIRINENQIYYKKIKQK